LLFKNFYQIDTKYYSNFGSHSFGGGWGED